MSSNNADRELMEALLQFDNILATKTVSPIAQFHAARQMDAPRMRRIGRLSEHLRSQRPHANAERRAGSMSNRDLPDHRTAARS